MPINTTASQLGILYMAVLLFIVAALEQGCDPGRLALRGPAMHKPLTHYGGLVIGICMPSSNSDASDSTDS